MSATEFGIDPVAPPEEPTSDRDGPQQRRIPRRSPRKGLIAIALLTVALLGTGTFLALYLVELSDANARIEEQERQLEKQRQLIEKKVTFGAAMHSLAGTASQFNGVLLSSLVPVDDYRALASRAWHHRWNDDGLDRDISAVRSAESDLDELLADAAAEVATNTTGTTQESVIDRLGGGFIATMIDDADKFCNTDVLACVAAEDPLTVHFDEAETSVPYMTDWMHTGVAYHEYAHVLQLMNPTQTEPALEAFAGDPETMADCYALVALEGWTLDHRIWTSDYEYWDVNIGYGHVCNESERQVIREWYRSLAFEPTPITQ